MSRVKFGTLLKMAKMPPLKFFDNLSGPLICSQQLFKKISYRFCCSFHFTCFSSTRVGNLQPRRLAFPPSSAASVCSPSTKIANKTLVS